MKIANWEVVYGIRPAASKHTPLESVIWGFIKNSNEVKMLMEG